MFIVYEPKEKQDELRKQLPPFAWLYTHTEIEDDIRTHKFKCPYVAVGGRDAACLLKMTRDEEYAAWRWQTAHVTEYAPLTIDERKAEMAARALLRKTK
jgi:hypothetical protein